MNRDTVRIALVCALGAFVGALLSLETARLLSTGLFGTIVSILTGIVTGGTVAYIAIDFRGLLAGMYRAYCKTIAWKPNIEFWKTWTMWMTFCLSIAFWFVVFIGSAIAFAAEKAKEPIHPAVLWVMAGGSCIFCFVSAYLSSILSQPASRHKGENAEKEWQKERADLWGFLKYVNPLGAVYYGLYYIVLGIWKFPQLTVLAWAGGIWVAKRFSWLLADIGGVLLDFAYATFIFVHSERRTICCIGGATGAVIGFCCGSALIGAAAGGALGLIQFELVSVRWLKLVPVPQDK